MIIITVWILSGYLAPEYATHGLFSVKSDVFSFGVLLLEIVSSMKNRGPVLPSQSYNLIGLVSIPEPNFSLISTETRK